MSEPPSEDELKVADVLKRFPHLALESQRRTGLAPWGARRPRTAPPDDPIPPPSSAASAFSFNGIAESEVVDDANSTNLNIVDDANSTNLNIIAAHLGQAEGQMEEMSEMMDTITAKNEAMQRSLSEAKNLIEWLQAQRRKEALPDLNAPPQEESETAGVARDGEPAAKRIKAPPRFR